MEELSQEILRLNSEDDSKKYWARHFRCDLSHRYAVFADDPRTEKQLTDQFCKMMDLVYGKLQFTDRELTYLSERLIDFEGKYSGNPEDEEDEEICWAEDAEELIFY